MPFQVLALIRNYGSFFACFFFVLSAYAQEELSGVSDKVAKMKTELNLTQQQVYAITPIIKEDSSQRMKLKQTLRQKGITDTATKKEYFDQLKQIENQQLSNILNSVQMNKWVEKQNLKEMLNPDQVDGEALGRSKGGHRHRVQSTGSEIPGSTE